MSVYKEFRDQFVCESITVQGRVCEYVYVYMYTWMFLCLEPQIGHAYIERLFYVYIFCLNIFLTQQTWCISHLEVGVLLVVVRLTFTVSLQQVNPGASRGDISISQLNHCFSHCSSQPMICLSRGFSSVESVVEDAYCVLTACLLLQLYTSPFDVDEPRNCAFSGLLVLDVLLKYASIFR